MPLGRVQDTESGKAFHRDLTCPQELMESLLSQEGAQSQTELLALPVVYPQVLCSFQFFRKMFLWTQIFFLRKTAPFPVLL